MTAIHTTTRTKPYVRIDTAGPEVQVFCAGAYWAGRSEIPAEQVSPAQLVELKTDPRLQVSEIEREIDPDAEAEAPTA